MNSVQHIANVCRVQPMDVNAFLVERGYQTKGPNDAHRFLPTALATEDDLVDVKEFVNYHARFGEPSCKTVLFWADGVLDECRNHFAKSVFKDLESLQRKIEGMNSYILKLEGRVAALEAFAVESDADKDELAGDIIRLNSALRLVRLAPKTELD